MTQTMTRSHACSMSGSRTPEPTNWRTFRKIAETDFMSGLWAFSFGYLAAGPVEAFSQVGCVGTSQDDTLLPGFPIPGASCNIHAEIRFQKYSPLAGRRNPKWPRRRRPRSNGVTTSWTADILGYELSRRRAARAGAKASSAMDSASVGHRTLSYCDRIVPKRFWSWVETSDSGCMRLAQSKVNPLGRSSPSPSARPGKNPTNFVIIGIMTCHVRKSAQRARGE